jgi:hypothetical protein
MSLHALIVFAAETAEHEEEGSKTAFYIAGGVLATWGFVMGILGTRRHADFPSASAAKGLMGISALLVVATMATAVLTG